MLRELFQSACSLPPPAGIAPSPQVCVQGYTVFRFPLGLAITHDKYMGMHSITLYPQYLPLFSPERYMLLILCWNGHPREVSMASFMLWQSHLLPTPLLHRHPASSAGDELFSRLRARLQIPPWFLQSHFWTVFLGPNAPEGWPSSHQIAVMTSLCAKLNWTDLSATCRS